MSKLLIVNNSLKNLRGHFFETSLAVAEAARALGLRPVLGGHISCPDDLVPDWLEFHPMFTTDHWMVAPLPRVVQAAEKLLPLSWHQPAQRLLRTPWGVLGAGRRVLGAVRRQHDEPGNSIDPLAVKLRRAGIGQEFAIMQQFQHDLQRFLEMSDCQPEDHVFLPTAHGRELAAIQRLFRDGVCESARPMFHLEFRHDLEKFRYQIRHRVFFDHVREQPLDGVHLYTDTEELSQEYEAFSGLRFGVLPIPFRGRLLRERTSGPKQICVAYFGDVRDEKGFHHLPDLVQALAGTGIRFLFQASLDLSNRNPRSLAALRKLKQMPPEVVRLIGVDGPLTPDDYYQFLAQADVLLCPYDAGAYRSRSSGIFTEALAAGIPTVVPAGSWLARQQPPGSGEAFTGRTEFIAAVKRICANLPRYRAVAKIERNRWLGHHSPENLVRLLRDVAGQPALVE